MKCQKTNCGKNTISFSDFCGEHSANKAIRKALMAYEEQAFNALAISEIELKKATFSDKIFYSASFDDVAFDSCRIDNCTFQDCRFTNTVFELCRFSGCSFISCNFEDTEFLECTINECIFSYSLFNQSSLTSDTQLTHTEFSDCTFTGGMLYEIKAGSGSNFQRSRFIQVGINNSHFTAVNFIENNFSKTSIYNCVFATSEWIQVKHDFKLTGAPKLCDFSTTRFIDTYVPVEMKQWNKMARKDKLFYFRIIDKIANYGHPNYLPELSVVLDNLAGAQFHPDPGFIQKINGIFKKQLGIAAESKDFRSAGDIINEYGKIPSEYRTSALSLSEPRHEEPTMFMAEARLAIQLDFGLWSLGSVHRLIGQFQSLAAYLPPGREIVVSDIGKGSFLITFWGDIKQLLFTGRMLDMEKLEIEVDNIAIDGELKKAELARKEGELTYLKEEQELKLNKARLENMKLEQEVIAARLTLQERIAAMYGFDLAAYAESTEGKEAAAVARNIVAEHEVITLKLTIPKNDSDKE